MSKVTFHVARHVADLIRNEPRNIGVIVHDTSRLVARFMGETAPGELDLRRVPPSVIPDRPLYAEWHRQWRNAVADSSPIGGKLSEMLGTGSSPAFGVQSGGEWYFEGDVVSEDDLAQLAEEIYRRIVDPSAVPFARGEPDMVVAATRQTRSHSLELAQKIANVFREANILETGRIDANLFAAHPVRLDQMVKGRNPVPHVPKFVQDNGSRYVFEQVDFEVEDAEAAREHAAYAAYMLSDILKASASEAHLPVKAIAVVNRVAAVEARRLSGGAAGALVQAQEYGLAVLEEDKDLQIVKWDDPVERRRFVDERIAVARSSSL